MTRYDLAEKYVRKVMRDLNQHADEKVIEKIAREVCAVLRFLHEFKGGDTV